MAEVDTSAPVRTPGRRPMRRKQLKMTLANADQFDLDLDYLLNTKSPSPVDSVKETSKSPSKQRLRKTKSLKFSVTEITQDIDDIQLSDEEVAKPAPRNQPMKKKQLRRNLNKKKLEADILAQFMADNNDEPLKPPPRKKKLYSQLRARLVSSLSNAGSRCGTPINGSCDDLADMLFISDDEPNTSVDEVVKPPLDTEDDKRKTISKKKSRSQLRKKRLRAKLREAKEAAASENHEDGQVEIKSSISVQNLPPTPLISEMASRKPLVAALIAGIEGGNVGAVNESPFEIKLRPLNINNTKKLEKLPEIQPVKLIIGLSEVQILKLQPTDVKMRTLMQSLTLSKYAQTGIQFTSRHTDELFANPEKQRIFFLLCINVALFEAVGFKKTTQQHADILELFGGYSEINLETTRTKLTPLNKQVHQNSLDYSVLSYLGNILIWAANLQRVADKDLLYTTYDLPVDTQTVRDNVGGWHLWDRLHRERKCMSSKRWKHVIKFRTAFPFEVDQFMLILRFMKADINNLL